MKTIKKHLFVITIIIFLIIMILILLLKLKLNQRSCDIIYEELPIAKAEETKEKVFEECTIDIKGAVIHPGVYTTDCEKYVNDIINLAGGLTEDADTSITNLAKQIKDEMVIIIYTKEDLINIDSNDSLNEEIINNTDINNSLININTASLNELESIPRIGEVKAKAIIEYRNSYGPFKDIKEIINVSGIGETLYEQIKIYITT